MLKDLKNYGYNNIYLEKPLMSLTSAQVATILASNSLYVLTNNETDLEQFIVHTDYDIDDLQETLNGNINSIISKIKIDDVINNVRLNRVKDGIVDTGVVFKEISYEVFGALNGNLINIRLIQRKGSINQLLFVLQPFSNE